MHTIVFRVCLLLMVFPWASAGLSARVDEGAWWCPLNRRTPDSQGYLRASYLAELPDRMVFFKIDQGAAYGRLLDQRMSNLHYDGPGGMLGFARHVRRSDRIAEWGASGGLLYTRPAHKGTLVYIPSVGLHHKYLWRVPVRGAPAVFAGIISGMSANVRYVPSLSNSFLFADLTASLQPALHVEYDPFFFERYWHFDFSASITMLGYGFRIPEYGVSFQIDDDGGSRLSDGEGGLVHPGNHFQVRTGVFYRYSMGGDHNPNWLRFGYAWDYFRHTDGHASRTYHASHVLKLQLFFLVN